MIEYEKIHHVSLAVRDLEKARSFYSYTLHFPEIQRPPFKSNGVWYAIGDQQLHLIEHPNGETLRKSGIDSGDGHLQFGSEATNIRLNGWRRRGSLMKRDRKA